MNIPLTREQLEAARLRMADQGIVLRGDSGDVEGHGVGISFSYDGSANLALTITHKPFIYPKSAVESKIRGWFEEMS